MTSTSANHFNTLHISGLNLPGVQESSHKEIFTPGHIEIPPQTPPSILGKTVYVLASVASLGLVPLLVNSISKYISRNVLPGMSASPERKMACKEAKKDYIARHPEKVQEFDLKLDDGAIVNGMAVFKNSAEKSDFAGKNAANQKWIINFNGNRQFYEEGLEEFEVIGNGFDANILAFNYRGVGESRGAAITPSDWVVDGEACIRYLLSKGVSMENIFIPGLSLGAAVGTITASMHRNIDLMNDRSFGLLSEEAAALTGNPWVGTLFRTFGCELDVVAAYNKITARKMIVFHKQDAVMPYHAAMYKMEKEFIKTNHPEAVYSGMSKGRLKERLKPEFKPNRVKLQKDFGRKTSNAHVYNIRYDKAYPKISEFIQGCLQKQV